MATLVLQAVGATLGSVFGPVGSAIGSAIGSAAGYAIDSAIINSTKHIEGARLSGSRPMSAEEGTPIARVYGYARVSGTVIWATQLEEDKTTTRQGAKGGPKVTTYSYYGNMAVALCEGKISAIKRVWADGKELDLRDVNFRVYLGDETQLPDPLIVAKQGASNTSAYRGLAYIVFERLPLERFGNRLPQIQVEVVRSIGKLESQVRAMSIIPGATEHGLDPSPVTAQPSIGETVELNRHQLYANSDWEASLDELQAVCPNLEHASLVVAWYCDDLRCGHASIRPAVVERESKNESKAWRVNGLSRAANDVHVVSKTGGSSAYGGTPTDASVLAAIADLKNRGLKVTLNPFVLMDIPTDNTLPDPYGDSAQAAYPWRGRITCHPAIGKTNSVDKSPIATTQVAAFCGQSTANNFIDFGYRRMILHYANLVVQAGGVDTFIIGSEMIGLSSVRGPGNSFPFVDALKTLAAEVRAIIGAQCHIIYGADWSEYFGYHPQDGSNDVFFNLDPLWADPHISAVAIDNYMPLSDWRDEDQDTGSFNPDGAKWRSDRGAFETAISAGEGYDWYYASTADRESRNRSPITDGAYLKPWVYRYKDLKSWWENPHYDRVGGVEVATPTAWQPRLKQIWFTELGCPAVDRAAVEPNAFIDVKSVESRLPAQSNGARDDVEQRAFLEAHHNYWNEVGTRNPVSSDSNLPMVDPARIYLWAWDARPFPIFPLNLDVWGDGENWLRGHWLNGRLGSAAAEGLFASILSDHGLDISTFDQVAGAISGVVVSSPATARATMEPLLQITQTQANDDGANEHLRLSGKNAYDVTVISTEDLVDKKGGTFRTVKHVQIDELPSEVIVTYRDAVDEYRSASAYSRQIDNASGGQIYLDVPAILDSANAATLADQILSQIWTSQHTISFALPLHYSFLKTGDVVALSDDIYRHWRIDRTTISSIIQIEAHSTAKAKNVARRAELPGVLLPNAAYGQFGGAPAVYILDLPMRTGSAHLEQTRLAIYGKPDQNNAVFISPTESGYAFRTVVSRNAVVGVLNSSIGSGFSGRMDYASQIEISLFEGELQSTNRELLLNGQNLMAVQSNAGDWEIVQFQYAEEVSPSRWILTSLLRGQGGTEDAMSAGADAGATVVLLNDAVVPLGLAENEIGLDLNIRVGPSGKEFSDRYFTSTKANLGLRALLPLAPVHISAKQTDTGGIQIEWVRRSRVNADSWLGPDVPLGEAQEEYRVTLSAFPVAQAQEITRTVYTSKLELTAPEIGQFAAGFPKHLYIQIWQISQVVGDGIEAASVVTVQ